MSEIVQLSRISAPPPNFNHVQQLLNEHVKLTWLFCECWVFTEDVAGNPFLLWCDAASPSSRRFETCHLHLQEFKVLFHGPRTLEAKDDTLRRETLPHRPLKWDQHPSGRLDPLTQRHSITSADSYLWLCSQSAEVNVTTSLFKRNVTTVRTSRFCWTGSRQSKSSSLLSWCWRGCTKKLTHDLFRIKLPLAQPFKSKFSLPIRNLKNAVAQLIQALGTSRKVAGSTSVRVIGVFLISLILLAALWAWGRLSL